MENNDLKINKKKTFELMMNAQEHFEKCLKYDNKKLRKEIEFVSKILNKFQQNPRKRAYKKLAKKSGIPFELFLGGLNMSSILFKKALDFDDDELREFIELFIEQAKINRVFLEYE